MAWKRRRLKVTTPSQDQAPFQKRHRPPETGAWRVRSLSQATSMQKAHTGQLRHLATLTSSYFDLR